MPTSTGTLRRMQRVGVLEFTLQGPADDARRVRRGRHEPIETLFVPFADQTTGKETYPAGRYLDLEPTSTGIYTIDFNTAYNPYLRLQRHLRVPVPAAVEPAEGRGSRRRKGARRMSRPLQAIVFDFDGVIANSEPLHLRAFQQALAEDGIELSAGRLLRALSRLRRRRHVPGAGAGSRACRWPSARVAELVARKGERLQDLMQRRRSVLFPGAVEFIREAAAAVPIAIASGALRHEIDEIIDARRCRPTLRDDRRRRRHAGEQAVAGAVPPGVRAAARARRARRSIRGAASPSRIRAGGSNRHAAPGLRCVGVTNSYPADELPRRRTGRRRPRTR